jgi:hypothetical protein
MAYAAGLALAFILMYFGRATALDRDRAFYPMLVIVIASYYVLFALMARSLQTLVVESVVMSAFVLGAVIGFKRNPWLVVACLGAHGVFDVLHDTISANPGVPDWWPAFCLTFDVGTAGLLALLLMRPQGARRPYRDRSRQPVDLPSP